VHERVHTNTPISSVPQVQHMSHSTKHTQRLSMHLAAPAAWPCAAARAPQAAAYLLRMLPMELVVSTHLACAQPGNAPCGPSCQPVCRCPCTPGRCVSLKYAPHGAGSKHTPCLCATEQRTLQPQLPARAAAHTLQATEHPKLWAAAGALPLPPAGGPCSLMA